MTSWHPRGSQEVVFSRQKHTSWMTSWHPRGSQEVVFEGRNAPLGSPLGIQEVAKRWSTLAQNQSFRKILRFLPAAPKPLIRSLAVFEEWILHPCLNDGIWVLNLYLAEIWQLLKNYIFVFFESASVEIVKIVRLKKKTPRKWTYLDEYMMLKKTSSKNIKYSPRYLWTSIRIFFCKKKFSSWQREELEF